MKYGLIFISLILLVTLLPACSADTADKPDMPSSTTPVITENTTAPSPTATRTSPNDRVPRITVEELYQKTQDNADILIIDARSGVDDLFADGHIPGSIPVSLTKFTEGWAPDVHLDMEIVLYCT